MMADFAFAASGAMALRHRPLLRHSLLARVLGLYIAISAGTIQLLDIVVDRLNLPDRLFIFTIVLAIIGIPVVITATLFYDVSRSDKRAPGRTAPSATAARAARQPSDVRTQAVAAAAPASSPHPSALPARLELALSHQRIAELHRASGAFEEAHANELIFEREAEKVIRELRQLLDRGQS